MMTSHLSRARRQENHGFPLFTYSGRVKWTAPECEEKEAGGHIKCSSQRIGPATITDKGHEISDPQGWNMH